MHEISNFDPYYTAISSINFFRDADDNVILAGHDLGDFHDIVKRAFFLISGSQNYLSDEALTPAQWNHLLVDGFLMENEMRIALGEGRERLASVNLDGIHPRPDWKSKSFPWIVEVYTNEILDEFFDDPKGYGILKSCLASIGAAVLYLVDHAVSAIKKGDFESVPPLALIWAKLLLTQGRKICALAPQSPIALSAIGAAARHRKNNELADFARRVFAEKSSVKKFRSKRSAVKFILQEVWDEATRLGLTYSKDNFEHTLYRWLPKK